MNRHTRVEPAWEAVGTVADFEPDKPERCELGDIAVMVVRTSGGDFHALYDVCSHAEVALSEGEVVDGEIECWLHGSTFSLKTGKPSCLPAVDPVPVYPTKIEGDVVYVATNVEL
jgi:3-phenylpropionate/trans-cinnamate dioxygenase ferredoxin component